MRIVLTESQYGALIRRLDDFVLIDRQFKYQLNKIYPCDYSNFEVYFDLVSYRTESFIINSLYLGGFIDNNIELRIKLRNEIANYIEDNLKEYTEEYYNQYKEKHCLNK